MSTLEVDAGPNGRGVELQSLDAAAWDRLTPPDDPFTEYAFLRGLEATGCVGARNTGWIPRHVVVRRAGALVGAVPLYEKWDSFGEFIFDFPWARAAQTHRIAYFPKLVCAVPFTPATGRRLLVAPGEDEAAVSAALCAGVRTVAERTGASSVHWLFVTQHEVPALERAGFLIRGTCQFMWQNVGGWRSFDDWLGALRASARKQIRKERAVAASHGLELSVREGPSLGDAEWDALWRFYVGTAARHGGETYLTHAFFEWLRARHASRVLASFAHRGGRPVAGALFLARGSSIFGRYWGCDEELDSMHFELCYHRPLEFGLARGLQRCEAGAQGEHKIKRGFSPGFVWSAHWLRHPALEDGVRRWIAAERVAVEAEIAAYSELSPLRRDPQDGPQG